MRTLRDADDYVQSLPPDEQQHDTIQKAPHILLQATDNYSRMMLPRSGVWRKVRTARTKIG
ncbi:hypothetical protein I8G32_01392 [Rhodopseudomonas palustris]|uniref:Uncharacterized protein n=1 Tax=Rhodopseudomonas palustris (strain ATCC BAA-98 / CGA009) TaxID=258594 RepID=Q6NA25_RHOPA|nr:hypothetical protein [Rhodopseudomonas palustris]OPF91388.1 hypothetical protein B1S06_18080 [Rhodopseudomonas palustris]QQM02857.1 hypothetical protein I8G32_01392 [Rhodopseudomonas palustris]WAB79033.1 hypothetical protein OR798_06995 [Rhodopseudomonas palustris]WCL91496.1 hypothetical protein TX73_006990 [Rhodopseudomonas palustris CGA009]WND52931.1 hypothetical protein L1A21_06965 [Rhodopseudomonas palustris]